MIIPCSVHKCYSGDGEIVTSNVLLCNWNSAHVLYSARSYRYIANRFGHIRTNRYKINIVYAGGQARKVKFARSVRNRCYSVGSHDRIHLRK